MAKENQATTVRGFPGFLGMDRIPRCNGNRHGRNHVPGIDGENIMIYDLNEYNDVMVKQPGRSRVGRMDKRQAMEEVIKLDKEGRAGELSTGMCDALDISFESFLKFAQINKKRQAFVVHELAKMFKLKLRGNNEKIS